MRGRKEERRSKNMRMRMPPSQLLPRVMGVAKGWRERERERERESE